ncbi:hypothetical protein THIOSC15_3550028 [uncultured Thiomicrorhabdus sp.]
MLFDGAYYRDFLSHCNPNIKEFLYFLEISYMAMFERAITAGLK